MVPQAQKGGLVDDLRGRTAVVVGASRGLGRGIAESYLDAGAHVVALARDTSPLAALSPGNPRLNCENIDATDSGHAERLLAAHRPDILALVAGAATELRPLQEHTWESFSLNWHVDVRIAFTWLRAALRLPLGPGSRVIVVSSGAALRGSPISGGYAGAKATTRFLADYAAQESERAGLGITFSTVMPQLTGETALGRPAVLAYAERAGITVEQFVAGMGPSVTPQLAGAALLQLASGKPAAAAGAHLLTGEGLRPLP
jgi:3-oxoacyl-[acyl-carrier protein] reductase